VVASGWGLDKFGFQPSLTEEALVTLGMALALVAGCSCALRQFVLNLPELNLVF